MTLVIKDSSQYIPEATKYIKQEYHKYVAPYQYTVHLKREHTDPYFIREDIFDKDILNTAGRRYLNRLRERIKTQTPVCVIKGHLERSQTGQSEVDGIVMLTTWNNLRLTGTILESSDSKYQVGRAIETSPLLFYEVDEKGGWVYTIRHSYYVFVSDK